MAKMMGTPLVDRKLEDVHIQLWLISQKQHKAMMEKMHGGMGMKHDEMGMKHDSMGMGHEGMGMKHDNMGMSHEGMGMNKAQMDSMMSGTNLVAVELTSASTGKAIPGGGVSLDIDSPSMKSTSVDLKSMMGHFVSPLTLDEKGKYSFTLKVAAGEMTKTANFTYTVK
jgi:hypothetical protein